MFETIETASLKLLTSRWGGKSLLKMFKMDNTIYCSETMGDSMTFSKKLAAFQTLTCRYSVRAIREE